MHAETYNSWYNAVVAWPKCYISNKIQLIIKIPVLYFNLGNFKKWIMCCERMKENHEKERKK